MPKYQVKFRVNAIIAKEVEAPDFFTAINEAKEEVDNEKLFHKDIEYIDGIVDYSGIDNLDDWDFLNE